MVTATELPVDTSASAEAMADEMFGAGIKIVSASYTGSANASGIFSNGDSAAPGVTPSDSGVILSTGNAKGITNASGDANAKSSLSTSNKTAGDAELDSISGQKTFDAAVLEATFVPSGSTLTMQVVFASEEYLEYVNSGFNDAVGIWVNGQPAELTVGTGAISIDSINDQVNSNLYIDNPETAEVYNTEMDGFTVTLTLKAPVNPGVENTIKIGIADGGDSTYDSNLLIAGNSVQTELIAGDDMIEVTAGQAEGFDLLANDVSVTGAKLTITEINGKPVVLGDTVTLSSGEQIMLTETGIKLLNPDAEAEVNSFTYTVEDDFGNKDVGLATIKTVVPCFTLGTLIETPSGPVPVERLRAGDLVVTLDHGPRPLAWVGVSERRATGRHAPIRFERGALGAHDALELSAQHRVLVASPLARLWFGASEVLVKARDLVNGRSIRRREDGLPVTYVHLLFERHEVVCGNGLWSESYQPGWLSLEGFDRDCREELLHLFPGLSNRSAPACFPSARPSLDRHEARLLIVGARVPHVPLAVPARVERN